MSYENPRIDLADTMMDVLVKMSDGNPGALTAMMEILADDGKTDPDSVFGSLGTIMSLDTADIYGTDIYLLWNDVCKRNTAELIGVMRAVQLGFVSHEAVRTMLSRGDRSQVGNLITQVRERLPNFAR
jgi:hypothetical protein